MLIALGIVCISQVSAWADEVPIEVVENSDEGYSVPQEKETTYDIDDIYDVVQFGVYSLWFGFGSLGGFLTCKQFLP